MCVFIFVHEIITLLSSLLLQPYWLTAYTSNDDHENKESNNVDDDEEDANLGALAPITVPDLLPEIPVLALSRNPLFPRFVKMVEVSVY